MLEKLKQNYEKLLKSKEFKNKGFLCGAFLLCEIENLEKTNWEIDFYDKHSDTITSYIIEESEIKIEENSKVFKEENTDVEELKLDEIKLSFDEIKKELDSILKKYDEEAVKITVILQNKKVPLWNIIYITKKFNLLNIKIDGTNGKVIEEKIVSLLSFEKGGKSN